MNSAQGLLFNLLNMSGAVLGSGSGFDLTSVALPQPPRASVVFSQRLVAADLSGFQVSQRGGGVLGPKSKQENIVYLNRNISWSGRWEEREQWRGEGGGGRGEREWWGER